MAWLNTAPKAAEGSKDTKPPLTRLKQIKKDGGEAEYPPVETRYLIDYFFEIGPTQSGGMGNAPLSFLELQAWQERMGIDLEPWETRMLRALSVEYLNESSVADERGAKAPYRTGDAVSENVATAKNMKAAIAALAAQ